MPFEIVDKRCEQCLFSKDRVVDGERAAAILAACREKDTHFICHKFSIPDPKSQVCCRGFFETQPPTQIMRIAGRLGQIAFVPVPDTDLGLTSARDMAELGSRDGG